DRGGSGPAGRRPAGAGVRPAAGPHRRPRGGGGVAEDAPGGARDRRRAGHRRARRTPPPVPEKDITDSVALLRWLADDNFTFLGYREYDLVDGDVLRARMGSGLGILRSDQATPRRLSEMGPQARARALERRLLIITKANSRATVHRSAYLDYIGLKTFDADGNVTGERR